MFDANLADLASYFHGLKLILTLLQAFSVPLVEINALANLFPYELLIVKFVIKISFFCQSQYAPLITNLNVWPLFIALAWLLLDNFKTRHTNTASFCSKLVAI